MYIHFRVYLKMIIIIISNIKGNIKNDTSNGTANPVIVVEHIEKDLNPDTSYVYPF